MDNSHDIAISMMESGAELTDEQLALLQTDARVAEACQDVFMAASLLERRQMAAADVEQRLRRFHERHGQEAEPVAAEGRTRAAMRPLRWGRHVLAVLGAAAVLLSFIFLLRPRQQETAAPMAQAQVVTVFQADSTQGVTLCRYQTQQPLPVHVARGQQSPDMVLAAPAVVTPRQQEALPLQVEERLLLSVPYGESLQMDLPDGTRVFMHPGSRLVYPTAFLGTERRVGFSGEAYFCVAADADGRPFVVETPHALVHDYGTEFNVSTLHPNGTQVVLVQGSVGVASADAADETLLLPGQMGTVATTSAQVVVTAVDTDPYESWRDGYFHFEEATLRDILTALGRYYNVTIECSQPELLRHRMRFITPRDRNLDYAIELLNRMKKVSVARQGHKVVVSERE